MEQPTGLGSDGKGLEKIKGKQISFLTKRAPLKTMKR
jgi:hypothetical protein